MIKKLPKSRVEIKLSVPSAEWEKYLDSVASEISKEIKIQGFRPGKAPRNLVEQKVGKEMLLNGAAEKAIQKSYVDFVSREKLEALGNPEVEIVKLEEGQDLEFVARVDVLPEIALKESYKKDIKKINEEYAGKSSEPTDEEVQEELKKLANSRVKLVTVNREAGKNDSVEIDFDVIIDGKVIDGGHSKNHPLIIGNGVFIPGFEDHLLGMKEHDAKEFDLEFPQDYHKKDLAGKKATFKVVMRLVQERQTPELNDDFAKSLGKFEKLEDLRKNMQEGLLEEKNHKLKEEKRAKYLEKIVSNSKVELPDSLVKREVSQMMHEFEHQLQMMNMSVDQYLFSLKKERKELEKDWEPQAIDRVISAMALKEIAKAEEMNVDAKIIEEEMNKTLQYYKNIQNIEKNIDMERLYAYTKDALENEKVFEFLEKI